MVARSSVAAGNESLCPGSDVCLVSDLTCGSTAPSSSRSRRRLASAARLHRRPLHRSRAGPRRPPLLALCFLR